MNTHNKIKLCLSYTMGLISIPIMLNHSLTVTHMKLGFGINVEIIQRKDAEDVNQCTVGYLSCIISKLSQYPMNPSMSLLGFKLSPTLNL